MDDVKIMNIFDGTLNSYNIKFYIFYKHKKDEGKYYQKSHTNNFEINEKYNFPKLTEEGNNKA